MMTQEESKEADGRRSSVDGRGTSVCIACSKRIASSCLSKSVVHSCCLRPVCASCLYSRPRLATFCVLCEGVHHALRRGPRDDVTRAGQVVFDFDRIEAMDGLSRPNEGDEEAQVPPPAYSENETSNDFVIEQENESGESTNGTPGVERADQACPGRWSQMPSLIDSERLNSKKTAVNGTVDVHEQAVGRGASQIDAEGSLRDALSKTHAKQINAPSSSAVVRRPNAIGRRAEPTEPTDNTTRQYWLRSNDSLMSLSLRFGVPANVLCKLNDLPTSTISTTPHLIHTRRFLLVPEHAVRTAISTSSEHAALLECALQGPAPLSQAQKLRRARREAQSKFRALVTQSESRTRASSSSTSIDVAPCDERAARAYVTLMEDELRHISFGDECDDRVDVDDDDSRHVAAEDEALVDAARQRRYDAIVQQAVCRWEMDSDWERKQRSQGMEPDSSLIGRSDKPLWSGWTWNGIQKTKATLPWMEKGR